MTLKALLAAKTGEAISTRVVEMNEQDLKSRRSLLKKVSRKWSAVWAITSASQISSHSVFPAKEIFYED